MTESPALALLREAVEKFAADQSDGLVAQALLIYETVGFDDDGDTFRSIHYTVPTDNFSLSGGLGLIEAARYFIRRDVLGADRQTDYTEWTVSGDNYGDVAYLHSACRTWIDSPSENKLADDLALIDAHDCPGPPSRERANVPLIAGVVFPRA